MPVAEVMAVTPPLSIVMPAHNEAGNIEAAIREWHDEVIARLPGSEIIVVDDASRDDTGRILSVLAESLEALRVVSLTQNAGHGPATRTGLDHARGTYVFQTDSDRQHTPAEFWAFWERREDADLVIGVRRARADGLQRAVISGILRKVNTWMWGRAFADANCPFKLMRRGALDDILPRVPRDTFIPMVMIVLVAHHLGYRIEEMTVQHFQRRAGANSLAGLRKWMRIGTRCLRELRQLRASLSDVPRRSAVRVP